MSLHAGVVLCSLSFASLRGKEVERGLIATVTGRTERSADRNTDIITRERTELKLDKVR